MSTPTILLWAEHFDTLAERPADISDPAPVIPPAFATWRGHVAASRSDAAATSGSDDALWDMLANGAGAPDRLGALLGASDATGPIHPARGGTSLEVWTERELSAMHALLWLGRSIDSCWIDRAFSAARWHVQETQPDNATNRPWAVHLFLLLGLRDDDHEARLYAETLLSNCQVAGGRPDLLSALILADAADALRHAHRELDTP